MAELKLHLKVYIIKKLLNTYFNFVDLIFEEGITSPGYFWTSGTDIGCESAYGFCVVNRLLRNEAIWAPGQPDNDGGLENHLAIWVDANVAQLSDFNEQSKMRYICEVCEAEILPIIY